MKKEFIIVLLVFLPVFLFIFIKKNKTASLEIILPTSIKQNYELICTADSLTYSEKPYPQYLTSAKNQLETLDIHILGWEGPITNDFFSFRIESPEDKKLFIEIFDEQGFSTGPTCQFEVQKGSNYKTVNVAALKLGHYIAIIKDYDGKNVYKNIYIEPYITK
jgi:hypothetical protein